MRLYDTHIGDNFGEILIECFNDFFSLQLVMLNSIAQGNENEFKWDWIFLLLCIMMQFDCCHNRLLSRCPLISIICCYKCEKYDFLAIKKIIKFCIIQYLFSALFIAQSVWITGMPKRVLDSTRKWVETVVKH